MALAGCKGTSSDVGPLGASPGTLAYLVSSGMSGRSGFSRKGLTIVSRTNWKPVRSIPLGGEGQEYVSLDPAGRVWVAHYGLDTDPGTTVEVFQPDGDRIAEISTCMQNRRVVFAADHAFVACEQNGFKGMLKRIDLKTFEIDGTADVSFPPSSFAIVAGTGTIAGTVAVPCTIDGNPGTSGVISFDPATLAVIQARSLGPTTVDVEQMLPYGASALLLNLASAYAKPAGSISDVFRLDGVPSTVTGMRLFGSPRAGTVMGDMLFGYSIIGYAPPQATISHRNMTTEEVGTWPSSLPGTVERMDSDGQQVFLAHYETTADAADGLYVLDTDSGQLSQLVNVPDVTDFALGSGS